MNFKRVLITGSEGNIGGKLCPYLIEMGYHILRCDIIHKFDENYIMSDIVNPSDLYRMYDEYSPHIVVHMAAKVSRVDSEKSPCLTVDTNLSGLNNIIQLCLRNNAKLVYFSTSEVYGNLDGILSEDREDLKPNNIYGLTKYLGEQLVKYYVKYYSLDAVILRPFMFYNEDQKGGKDKAAINRFIYDILDGKKIRVHKESTRSWMHISDAVSAIEKSMNIKEFAVINIGHPEIIKTEELATKICLQLGVNYSDYVIEENLPKQMTLRKEPSLENQKKYLDFEPRINIDEGISKIINKAR